MSDNPAPKELEIGGKKIPRWIIFVGAGGVVLLILAMRNKSQGTQDETVSPAQTDTGTSMLAAEFDQRLSEQWETWKRWAEDYMNNQDGTPVSPPGGNMIGEVSCKGNEEYDPVSKSCKPVSTTPPGYLGPPVTVPPGTRPPLMPPFTPPVMPPSTPPDNPPVIPPFEPPGGCTAIMYCPPGEHFDSASCGCVKDAVMNEPPKPAPPPVTPAPAPKKPKSKPATSGNPPAYQPKPGKPPQAKPAVPARPPADKPGYRNPASGQEKPKKKPAGSAGPGSRKMT